MRVQFSRAAQADIQSIYDFIAFENPAAAKRVISEIELAVNRLADFPLLGRTGAVENTRELALSRLPYIVVYAVGEDAVEIIAVFHAAQDKQRGF
jgi:addiction module RelE/StbE family toxin